MKEFQSNKLRFILLACPFCGAKKPTWSYHDSYERYLVSYENERTITYQIDITRIICSSCKHTHAILPDIIIPHSSYSLVFVLMVLKDYFSGKMKILVICEKYDISTSVLYAWKKLFLIHKKFWLGILEDMAQEPLFFLTSIFTINITEALTHFFLQNAYSFLQGISKTANFSSA